MRCARGSHSNVVAKAVQDTYDLLGGSGSGAESDGLEGIFSGGVSVDVDVEVGVGVSEDVIVEVGHDLDLVLFGVEVSYFRLLFSSMGLVRKLTEYKIISN